MNEAKSQFTFFQCIEKSRLKALRFNFASLDKKKIFINKNVKFLNIYKNQNFNDKFDE